MHQQRSQLALCQRLVGADISSSLTAMRADVGCLRSGGMKCTGALPLCILSGIHHGWLGEARKIYPTFASMGGTT